MRFKMSLQSFAKTGHANRSLRRGEPGKTKRNCRSFVSNVNALTAVGVM